MDIQAVFLINYIYERRTTKIVLGKQHIHCAYGRQRTTDGITQIEHRAKGVTEHINLTRTSAVTEMGPPKLYDDIQYYINISSFLLFILLTGDTIRQRPSPVCLHG